MSSKTFLPQQRVNLIRSKIPLSNSDLEAIPSPLPDTIYAILIARTSEKSKSWKLKLENFNIEFTLSSHAIKQALVPEPQPEREASVRSAPRISAFPLVNDVSAYIGLSDDEDSLDDEEWEEVEEEKDEEPQSSPSSRSPALIWNPIESSSSLIDVRPSMSYPMTLQWGLINLSQFGSCSVDYQTDSQDPTRRKFIHFFLLAFPVDLIHHITRRTNQSLESSNSRLHLTPQLFLKMIGLMYLMCLHPKPNRRLYWQNESWDRCTESNFSQFMPVSHYELFLQHLSWSEPDPNDKWSAVRDWFEEFNKRRKQTVVPSDRITVDEMMSMNRTNRTLSKGVPVGLPHQTKIARKPEGVGVEIRCAVDGRSGVMYQLELQESAADMALKPLLQETGKAGTACLLRLTRPLWNSGRTVYGDSAFASVNTAYHCRVRGLHFIGLVKTASVDFPKQYLKSLPLRLRSGDSHYVQSQKDDHPLIACGWWDKKLKMFIATAGSNLAAQPHQRIRYRLKEDGTSERFIKTTNITSVPHEYFSFAQKVDVHNHRRQGILAMERAIATENWAYRVICTLLGTIAVDAYLMYIQSSSENNTEGQQSFRDFMGEVCMALIGNSLGERKSRLSRSVTEMEADQEEDASCSLIPISEHFKTIGKQRKSSTLRCSICSSVSFMCCKRCSDATKTVAVCGWKAKRSVPCFSKHVESMLD